MDGSGIAKFRAFRLKNKYEILLLSFLILMFGDMFFPAGVEAMPILMLQNVLASIVIFYGLKKWRILLILLLLFLTSLEVLGFLMDIPRSRQMFSVAYIIYFIFLSYEVYRQIYLAKKVDSGMIAAVLCGFIIMGLFAGSVFAIIEIVQPNSFNNLSEGVGAFSDLIYFSFITILSIGYGDITPATDVAQKMAMFFGLVGYFYGVVVIGIIMGKYISNK